MRVEWEYACGKRCGGGNGVSSLIPAFDVLLKLFDLGDEFVAGFEEISGVVDDVGSYEKDEFRALMAVGFAAKESPNVRKPTQKGDAIDGAAGGFADQAADGDGISVLHGDLGLHDLL